MHAVEITNSQHTPFLRGLAEIMYAAYQLHFSHKNKLIYNNTLYFLLYIFPNGCLPSVRQIAQSSEPHFVMEDSPVSDVAACTRQPLQFRLQLGKRFMTIMDLPGVGSSPCITR